MILTVGGNPHDLAHSPYSGVGDTAPDCTSLPNGPSRSPAHEVVPRGGFDRRRLRGRFLVHQ